MRAWYALAWSTQYNNRGWPTKKISHQGTGKLTNADKGEPGAPIHATADGHAWNAAILIGRKRIGSRFREVNSIHLMHKFHLVSREAVAA